MADAAKVHDPSNRLWAAALRGFRGAGQNMYIYPSIFRELGGEWYDANKKSWWSRRSRPIKALEWYADLLRRYAPSGVGVGMALIRQHAWRKILAADINAHIGRRDQTRSAEIQGDRQDRLCALAQGSDRKARDVDLDLEFPDQRRAAGAQEEGNLALHPVVRVEGDAESDQLRVRGCLQAHRRQPDLALAGAAVPS